MRFREQIRRGESDARVKHRLRSHIQRVALERGTTIEDIVYARDGGAVVAVVLGKATHKVCGSMRGYTTHMERGEPACAGCYRAHEAYEKAVRERKRARDAAQRFKHCGTLKGVQAHRGRREKICKQCQLALDDAKAVKLRHEQQRKLIDEWRKKSNDAEIQREDTPVLA